MPRTLGGGKVLAAGVLAAGAIVVLALSVHGPSGARGRAAGPAERPVPVVAMPARTRDMGVYLSGLGSVTPLNTVTVRSRVDGQLMNVRFREGQMVSRGAVLAEIDPRPYEVQLKQAEGQLARDQALLNNARLDLQRYKVLAEQEAIPRQQLDTQEALVRQDEGAVKTDQGQVDNAKLQLIYCRITSPIDGRVGLRLVDRATSSTPAIRPGWSSSPSSSRSRSSSPSPRTTCRPCSTSSIAG